MSNQNAEQSETEFNIKLEQTRIAPVRQTVEQCDSAADALAKMNASPAINISGRFSAETPS